MSVFVKACVGGYKWRIQHCHRLLLGEGRVQHCGMQRASNLLCTCLYVKTEAAQ